jgi:hypothetical protein
MAERRYTKLQDSSPRFFGGLPALRLSPRKDRYLPRYLQMSLSSLKMIMQSDIAMEIAHTSGLHKVSGSIEEGSEPVNQTSFNTSEYAALSPFHFIQH